MVRISDILKKTEQKKAESEHPSSEAPALTPLSAQETESQPQSLEFKEKSTGEIKPEPSSEKGVNIFETVMAKNKLFNEEECLKLYRETTCLVEKIYKKSLAGTGALESYLEYITAFTEEKSNILESDLEDIALVVEKFVDQLCLDNNNILNLIILPVQNDYIFQHVVNVTIISIDLGLGLGYDKTKLAELGTVAILHDIGMVKFKDLYSQSRQLNQKECNEIKNHPKIATEILERFKGTYKKIIAAIYQSHERANGSGYPLGLKEEAIDEYAKIIGPADMYEALVHSRPYRSEKTPYEALRIMLENKNDFGKRIMKVLIERLASPFPLGSNIKLSSGEKGRVIRRNLGYPLRPVVEIMHDNKGGKLEKSRIIDLAQCPTIHIKSILELETIAGT